MNKLFIALLFACGLFVGQNIQAQYDNAIKIGTTGLSYERGLSDRTSIQLTGSVSLSNPFRRVNEAPTINFEDRDVTISIDDIKTGGFGLELQYRFYLNKDKGSMNGIYAAPFFSFNRGNFKDINGVDNLGMGFDYNARFDANRISFGGLIGTQWLLGANERFIIDFTWAGLGLSLWKISGEYTSTDESIDFDQQKLDIEAEIQNADDDIGFLNLEDRFDVAARNDGLDIDFNLMLPRYRFGLALGFAF